MDEKAIRGVPWTIVSYGVSKLVNLVTTIVLARLLAPADFGLLALANLALNLLGFVKDLGLGGTLIVRHDLDRRAVGTVLTLLVVVSALLGALMAAVAPLLADFFNEPRLTGVLAVMSSLMLISGFSSFYEVILQRELEFKRRFAALIVQSVVVAGLAIPLAALGAGVWSLVVGQIAALLVFGIVCFALSPYRVRPAFDRTQVRELFAFGSGFLLQNVALFARQNADYVAVGRAFGAASVGFYSMAWRLADLTYSGVSDPVARVTFPGFARARSKGDDIRPAFLSVLRLVALVTCPIGILLSAAADPFTLAVFGERWEPMIGPLAVLGVWAAIRPAESTVNWLLNSIGAARPIGNYSVAVLAVLVPALAAAVTWGTPTTVALVLVADILASFVVVAFYCKRRAAIGYGELWRAVAPVALAAIPAWVAGRLVADALAGSAPLIGLVASVAAGAAAFLAALTVGAPGVLAESVRQAGRTVGRGAAADSDGS